MLNFKEYLVMGGNLVLDGVAAERIDLRKLNRSEFVAELSKSLEAINKAFKSKNKFPIWNEDLMKNRQFLSGSAFHFFDLDGIKNDEFVKYKDSVGDIDTQVDSKYKDEIKAFLEDNKGKRFGDLTLIGHKNSIGQFISLWKSKKFGINIQIDLELADFNDEGHPTEWSRFSHSSSWEDMTKGIKGVAHKFMLRALNAKNRAEVIIQPKTARGKERLIVDAPLAFSLSGLRKKLEPVLDDKGKHLKKDGKFVYTELKPSETEYVTNVAAIFKAQFGKEPTKEEEKKMYSFTGLLDLVKKYYTKEDQLKVADGFVYTLASEKAQPLYREDKSREMREKLTMINLMAEKLGIPNDRWDDQIKAFFK